MPTQRASTGRGRRAGLTRDNIVDAALDFIDRDGLDGFSVRRLAAHLGVDPMSLYNHITNKDDILDGVVERLFAEVNAASPTPSDTWQDGIRNGATVFRDVMLRHPNAAVVLLTRRVLTDQPLAALRNSVTPLVDLGLTADDALHTVRAFVAFLTGTVLREVAAIQPYAESDPTRTAERLAEITSADDSTLSSVANTIAHIDHRAAFAYGLELFIDGLNARLPGSSRPRR